MLLLPCLLTSGFHRTAMCDVTGRQINRPTHDEDDGGPADRPTGERCWWMNSHQKQSCPILVRVSLRKIQKYVSHPPILPLGKKGGSSSLGLGLWDQVATCFSVLSPHPMPSHAMPCLPLVACFLLTKESITSKASFKYKFLVGCGSSPSLSLLIPFLLSHTMFTITLDRHITIIILLLISARRLNQLLEILASTSCYNWHSFHYRNNVKSVY